MATGPLSASAHGIVPVELALFAVKDLYYAVTLTAGQTLDETWPSLLALDPGGAGRTIVLEAEATSDGLTRIIYNTADAAENLTVNSDAPALVATVQRGEIYLFHCDGTSWYAVPLREGDAAGGILVADTINEKTAGAGVTIDSALIKDGHILDSVGFYDAAAPTKIVRLDAGTVTAGQTRVITMPDADVDLGAIPLASLLAMAADGFVGNNAGIAADPQHLTVAQAATLLNVATQIAPGTVEIATTAEVDTGTDDARAISPLALAGSAPAIALTNVTGNAPDARGFTDSADLTKIVRLDAGNVAAGQTRVITAPDADLDLAAIPGANIAGNIPDAVGFTDAGDPTKIARIDAVNVTAGQTRVITMADANVDLADLATQGAQITALGAENTDGHIQIPILSGTGQAGTWTKAAAAGLETVTHTPAAAAESYWIPVVIPGRSTASKGIKPTGLRVNYTVDTADLDDVRFELWKVTQGVDGAARTAAVIFGDADADYDAAHDTAGKRGDDTGAPELHLAVVTDAAGAAYLDADETLLLRVLVDGDAGPAGAFVLTSAVLLYSETLVDLA